MKKEQSPSTTTSSRDWVVYLLECADGTYYCGVTNNLKKRLTAHNAGKGAKYTRGRTPVSLVAVREGLTKSEAFELEYRVKASRRSDKIVTVLHA